MPNLSITNESFWWTNSIDSLSVCNKVSYARQDKTPFISSKML